MIAKLLTKWKTFKKRFYEIIEYQVAELKEKPVKVALGCALGIGINFIPTFGIGFIFAYLLAAIFRANRASATATSLLTGPLVPFKYALNFVVGGLILTPVLGKENLLEFIIIQYDNILQFSYSIENRIVGFIEIFGYTFMLGAAINAVLFGTGLHFLVMFLLRKYNIKS